MLTTRLIRKCWQDASSHKEDDVDFLLEENDWNDFSYYTTYHLHITRKRATQEQGAIYLGSIHIMRHEQQEREDSLLYKVLGGYKEFHSLPDGFYSMSFSIDVYKGLARYLSDDERKEFVETYRLILRETDAFYQTIKDDECFQKSLMRNGSMDSYELLRGRDILFQEGMQYNLREKQMLIHYANTDKPVELNFSAIKDMDDSNLPNGMIAFIGKNGSGKSTALYKLAALLYASPTDRSRYLSHLGTIEPKNLGISQLMIFSYTPFDNFILPGEDINSDLTLWAKNIESREGRFIFCGLRDVKKEAEEMIQQHKQGKDAKGDLKLHDVLLKPQKELSRESKAAYKTIEGDNGKQKVWEQCLNSMREEQPELFENAQWLEASEFAGEKSWNDVFQEMSTGHKFFFHSMLHIIAYCEENALLLFDEPENHLQSPLLSFMMKEVRKILAIRRSVMLIATHSPVILQETMAKNVRIVRRNGDKVSFEMPSIETFGESFGAIESEVFDLTTDRVRYFTAIDEIYAAMKCNKAKSSDEAIQRIEECMGGLSTQALHYIINKYHQRNRM